MRFGDKLCVFIAEGFGSGRAPVAPGTFGTVVGVAWVWAMSFFCDTILTYVAVSIMGILAAVWIGRRAEVLLGKKDPGQIVIDEIIAMPIAFASSLIGANGMDWKIFYEVDWFRMLEVFGLFRLFDVWKPWPIFQIQDIPNGWGLVLDDVLAAVYAATAMLVLETLF